MRRRAGGDERKGPNDLDEEETVGAWGIFVCACCSSAE